MSCLTNEAHFKLPSIRCKSLPSLLKSCISTPFDLSSDDEDTYYDLDTKHLILKELRNRAVRASSKRNEHFYSANLTCLFIPPSLENTDKQKDFQDITDNEDESEAFFSMKSNFSRCSSQGATASWDENKGVKAYQSVLEEFNHLEGWPFGLCRRPLVLPPLPNMPADSWMWHRRKSETKSFGVAN
ncbi:uncharacterized protein LOC144552742 isoform X2 [Carex rostrata]